MNKKYIPLILTLATVVIATFFWEKIILAYDSNNQIYGEYAVNQYNPSNDILRFLFFVSFPLSIFLFSYLKLNRENTFSLKQVIFNKENPDFKIKYNSYYNFFLIIFIIFLLLEFFSLDFSIFSNAGLDFFHEGTYLTPSNNLDILGGLWTSSYIELGLFGNFGPLFLWELFNVKSIGLVRFFGLFILLLNKTLLIFLSKKISENLLFSEKVRLSYFIILSLLSISLVRYEDMASEFGPRLFLFLIFFLIFFHSLFQKNKFSFLFFLLGMFSNISMIWYIDVGAYLNALLLLIIIYFFIRREIKKFLSILLGILFGWSTFLFILPTDELKEFFDNTLLIYTTYDYIIGLIYPTPFLSGDARSTRALLLVITAGIMVITINFNRNIKLNYYSKTFFIFLFFSALLTFNTALIRTDTPHIKSASGFTLFIIYSLGLYFLFTFLLNKNMKKIPIDKLFNFFEKNFLKLYLILILIFFSIFKSEAIIFKNIFSAPNQISKFINYNDTKYLTSDYDELVKYYKKLIYKEKCVQILTNEAALPYLLRMPTCNKYYLMWNSGPNQKKFINKIRKLEPKIILYSSEIDPYNDVFERTPRIIEYINKNYSFHSKFKHWTFVERN